MAWGHKINYTKEVKVQVIRLNRFVTEISKILDPESSVSRKSDMVTALFRMTQDIASGNSLNVQECIGQKGCSNYPPLLFNEECIMLACWTQYGTVKGIKENIKVNSSEMLTENNKVFPVMMDASHWLRRLSFAKCNKFSVTAYKYQHFLAKPQLMQLRFTCDLITAEARVWRKQRGNRKLHQKIYGVTSVHSSTFFKVLCLFYKHNAQLLPCLCKQLYQDELQHLKRDNTKMYLGY